MSLADNAETEEGQAMTPFGYVKGPYYVYVIRAWEEAAFVPIYVGRGAGRRAKAYYKLRTAENYSNPKTHNVRLNERIAEVRKTGREIGIFAHDCGSDKRKSQQLEREIIRGYGRLDKNNGSLYNRNWGG